MKYHMHLNITNLNFIYSLLGDIFEVGNGSILTQGISKIEAITVYLFKLIGISTVISKWTYFTAILFVGFSLHYPEGYSLHNSLVS